MGGGSGLMYSAKSASRSYGSPPTANQSPDVETSHPTLEPDMHDGSDRSTVDRGESNRGQRARCSGRRIASRPPMIGMEA